MQEPKQQVPVDGILAEFDHVTPLLQACRRIQSEGYQHFDAHTPFPVHGLDGAMGIRPTRLPWLVLLFGLTGLAGGLLMQWWMNAIDYPYHISGKPLFGLPAAVPVTYECVVLCSALAVFFGSLIRNGLPAFFHPLFLHKRFARATDDRFFVYVEARDPKFDRNRLHDLFHACRAVHVEVLHHDRHSSAYQFPRGSAWLVAIVVVASLLPFAYFAKARLTTSSVPRIHVLPDDMDNQMKMKTQSYNSFFADGRSMRKPPAGVVPFAAPPLGLPEHTGRNNQGQWLTEMPTVIHEATMARGQERFMVYCAPCHGLSGKGDGLVARRAEALQQGTWVAPSSLHEDRLWSQPVGELFHNITYGIRSMPGYASQIDAKDRWAIVAYVKALQLSRRAPKSMVPSEILPSLQ